MQGRCIHLCCWYEGVIGCVGVGQGRLGHACGRGFLLCAALVCFADGESGVCVRAVRVAPVCACPPPPPTHTHTQLLSDLSVAFGAEDVDTARSAAVRLQYYTKLLAEVENWQQRRIQ
jgi:hypothetical protein